MIKNQFVMNPMFIWYCVAGLVMVWAAVELALSLSPHRHGHHSLIGKYKERDIFFVPGDRRDGDDDGDDD